ncbi:MAG TPA: DUF3090 family protein [Candidatus Dormibacteraeota bacterium]|nr:DUF3090 family protein [Candidatus Dormibacteraeota bacterium]
MAILEFDLDPVDDITVGVEGEPGSRIFFLEARQGRQQCTLMVEKVQLQELGGQLLQLLEPPPLRSGPAPGPVTRPGDPPGWRVGNIQLSLDEEGGLCTLLLEERRRLPLVEDEEEEVGALEATAELEEIEEDDDPELRSARLVATISQVRALAERALQVVEGGRAVCPLCHLPIDPQGHVCPASNGHRRA